MANKETIANEKVTVPAPTEKTKVSGLRQLAPPVSNKEEENDISGETYGYDTLYTGTNTFLYVSENKGDKRTFYNYYIYFGLYFGKDEKGEDIILPQKAFFNPVARKKGDFTFDVLNRIYKDKEFYSVDIVKTLNTINNVERITYSLRLTYLMPDGGNMIFNFRAAQASDTEVFENYIERLRAAGLMN